MRRKSYEQFMVSSKFNAQVVVNFISQFVIFSPQIGICRQNVRSLQSASFQIQCEQSIKMRERQHNFEAPSPQKKHHGEELQKEEINLKKRPPYFSQSYLKNLSCFDFWSRIVCFCNKKRQFNRFSEAAAHCAFFHRIKIQHSNLSLFDERQTEDGEFLKIYTVTDPSKKQYSLASYKFYYNDLLPIEIDQNGLERVIGDLFSPKISYQKLVREFRGHQRGLQRSFNRYSRDNIQDPLEMFGDFLKSRIYTNQRVLMVNPNRIIRLVNLYYIDYMSSDIVMPVSQLNKIHEFCQFLYLIGIAQVYLQPNQHFVDVQKKFENENEIPSDFIEENYQKLLPFKFFYPDYSTQAYKQFKVNNMLEKGSSFTDPFLLLKEGQCEYSYNSQGYFLIDAMTMNETYYEIQDVIPLLSEKQRRHWEEQNLQFARRFEERGRRQESFYGMTKTFEKPPPKKPMKMKEKYQEHWPYQQELFQDPNYQYRHEQERQYRQKLERVNPYSSLPFQVKPSAYQPKPTSTSFGNPQYSHSEKYGHEKREAYRSTKSLSFYDFDPALNAKYEEECLRQASWKSVNFKMDQIISLKYDPEERSFVIDFQGQSRQQNQQKMYGLQQKFSEDPYSSFLKKNPEPPEQDIDLQIKDHLSYILDSFPKPSRSNVDDPEKQDLDAPSQKAYWQFQKEQPDPEASSNKERPDDDQILASEQLLLKDPDKPLQKGALVQDPEQSHKKQIANVQQQQEQAEQAEQGEQQKQ